MERGMAQPHLLRPQPCGRSLWPLQVKPVTSWMPWSDPGQLDTWQRSQPIPGLYKAAIAFKLGDSLLHSNRFLGSQIRTNSTRLPELCSDLHSLSRYSAVFCVCPSSSPDSFPLAADLLGPSDTQSSWHQPGFTRQVSPFLLRVTTTMCKERPSKYWRPNFCPDRIPTYTYHTSHHESESVVAPSCLTLWDPVDCSPSGSSVHGISQARILEWIAISFSKGSSLPRDWTWVSCIAGRFFTVWATREAP